MVCITCKQDKPADAFARTCRSRKTPGYPRHGECREGRVSQCRVCKHAYDHRRWREGKKGNPTWEQGERANRYRLNYGITVGEYETLLSEQGGVCAICQRPPKKRRLDIDHNHTTGEIRGLLCNLCNRGLAYIRRPEHLAQAAQYLRSTVWGK